VFVHAIRRRRRRHRPNPRPIVGRGVHRGGQKQAQTIGIQRKKYRPRDAVKKQANTITKHSTSVPFHFACTHQPQRRRRHRSGFLRRAMPPAVVRAPAVSLRGDARTQRPHTQQVNQATAHPTQSTYPSVSPTSTVQAHHCPQHPHTPSKAAPRALKRALQTQERRARHPTACNVLLHAVRRRRRRHCPNPRPIVGRGVHRGGQKQAQTIGIQRKKYRPRDAVKKQANTITKHSTSVPFHFACTHQPQRRRRHRPDFLQRAMPPAVVRAPAVSSHGDARTQRPHTQQVN